MQSTSQHTVYISLGNHYNTGHSLIWLQWSFILCTCFSEEAHFITKFASSTLGDVTKGTGCQVPCVAQC